MIKQNSKKEFSANLRKKAEEQINHKKSDKIEIYLESDNLKLIHELEVHQIELQMQNEELNLANEIARTVTEKYEELYDFAPSGYFTLSRQGDIQEINIRGTQILGKRRSSLLNSKFAFFIKKDSRDDFDKFLEEIFEGHFRVSGDFPLISSSNANSYVNLVGIISENPEQCYVTALDITERIKIENELNIAKEKLEESELKYRLIFDKSLVSILVADDKGNYLSANNAASQLLGYSVEEILAMNVGDLKTTPNSNTQQRYLEYLEKGEETGEFEFISKSGDVKIAKYLAIRVKKDFNLSMMIDITEQKINGNK